MRRNTWGSRHGHGLTMTGRGPPHLARAASAVQALCLAKTPPHCRLGTADRPGHRLQFQTSLHAASFDCPLQRLPSHSAPLRLYCIKLWSRPSRHKQQKWYALREPVSTLALQLLTRHSRPLRLVSPRDGRCAARIRRTCHTTFMRKPKTRDGNRPRAPIRRNSRRTWQPTTAPKALRLLLPRRPKARFDVLICLSSTATADVPPAGENPTLRVR